jgi:hypothetical protein
VEKRGVLIEKNNKTGDFYYNGDNIFIVSDIALWQRPSHAANLATLRRRLGQPLGQPDPRELAVSVLSAVSGWGGAPVSGKFLQDIAMTLGALSRRWAVQVRIAQLTAALPTWMRVSGGRSSG